MSLKHGIAIYSEKFCGGSEKTRFNHVSESSRFAESMKENGFKVQDWKNVSNKHVAAYVAEMQERGLATSTIKESLAGIRAVCEFHKNESIHQSNSSFGIENRVYVDNTDKSVTHEVYTQTVHELKEMGEERLAAQVAVCYEFGLRKEEAFKLNPSRDLINNGQSLFVTAGTKGGRERIVPIIHESQKEALRNLQKFCSSNGNSMNSSEAKYEKHAYYILSKIDFLDKKFHAFRHSYAQDRYEQISGFQCRVQFDSKEDFIKSAHLCEGENWKEKDREARLILKAELGHGPDRDDVISQYIGSSSK